jgi:hypothetical protein
MPNHLRAAFNPFRLCDDLASFLLVLWNWYFLLDAVAKNLNELAKQLGV